MLVLSLGLHWAVLQTIAWTGMIVKYSRDASFTEAVSKTFDGEHPCKLCLAIEKGRADEKKQEQDQARSGAKLDPGLIWQPVAFYFDGAHARIPNFDVCAPARLEPPPKPRPRLFPADKPA